MVQLGHGSLQGSLATVWIQSNSISNFQQGGSISHAPYNPQCNAEMTQALSPVLFSQLHTCIYLSIAQWRGLVCGQARSCLATSHYVCLYSCNLNSRLLRTSWNPTAAPSLLLYIAYFRPSAQMSSGLAVTLRSWGLTCVCWIPDDLYCFPGWYLAMLLHMSCLCDFCPG